MRLYLKGVIVATAVLGWGWSSSIVGEASNYSARRANSVRLVWRHSMGRHAYHTVKGARYSKHLGVKYSTNDDLPDVTWYTDAHEKLYNKAKRTSAIYYHVKSGDGQHGGWIWRGYLNAEDNQKISTDKGNTISQQVEIKDWNLEIGKGPINKRDIKLMKMFPQTLFDREVFESVSDYLHMDNVNAFYDFNTNTSSGMESFRELMGRNGINAHTFQVFEFVLPDDNSYQSMNAALSKAGLSESNRRNYAGWHIGVEAMGYSDDDALEGIVPGEGLVILVKD